MKEKKTLSASQLRQRKRNIQNGIRRIIQLGFFIFLPSLFSEAFSGIKGIFNAVSQGDALVWNEFLKTFVILAGITILFGRYFCGYACAFGSFGDFIYGIRSFLQKKTKKKFPKIPEKAIVWLWKLKYINLLMILCAVVFGYSQQISANSPWEAFSRLRAGNLQWSTYSVVGLVYLALILVGMFFEERFFCQFLCPLGAVFSLLPILPTGTLKRNASQCISGCSACKRQCPVHHRPEGISAHSNECIQCGRCSLVCPKGNISLKKEKVDMDKDINAENA